MKIQFFSRTTFNLACEILKSVDNDLGHCFDIGHADMIISFFNERAFNSGISDLAIAQIWNRPSFKGDADYQVID